MMRIGMFSNAYKPIISGVVRSISLYRKGLEEAGHFVALFAPEGRGYEDDEPFIFRYPAVPLRMDYTFPVVMAPQITWLVPRLKLQVLHAHHPFILGKEAVNFSQALGIPLVFTFHTLYHEYTHYVGFETDIAKRLTKRLVGDYANQAHRIIAPSARVLELLPEYRIERPVDILPTPVDLSVFPPRQHPPLINDKRKQLVYVGRVAKEKNLDFLLRAFARAAAEDPALHLKVVGGGPELGALGKYAESLGVAARVNFLGPVPFDQVPRELLTSDIFVFASTTETQGLVVLEAMAAGLPLVLVNSVALLESARPGVDCLVSVEDEIEFAENILLLVRNPGRARAMGRAARANAERFSVPVLTQRLLGIYQETIDDYHRASHAP
ncbi:MAG: glycosyltransferase family 4 protein [Chloroflexi bacterium]|nr:glycosyltransferase family 4 protein [Chloroflexota bacterium]